MRRVVAEKNANFGSIIQFVGIIRTQVGPINTAKSLEKCIIGPSRRQARERRLSFKNRGWTMINEKTGSMKSISPILARNTSVGHERKLSFNNTMKFAFNKTILLMGVRINQSIRNTN